MISRMSIPFVDRPPKSYELENLRLLLSTFQDGTGQNMKQGKSTPGWRDLERSVAVITNGIPQESKAVFDILIPGRRSTSPTYGLSCKMRRELNRLGRVGSVTMELSNSLKKFWARLKSLGITEADYKGHPTEVGIGVIELYKSWHNTVSIANGGKVDLAKSSYLVLSWSLAGEYQLHQFPILSLPDPRSLSWHFGYSTNDAGEKTVQAHINGDDATGRRVFEWYGESGGQLKYYPLATTASWTSKVFKLELLPDTIGHGQVLKAKAYFGNKWTEPKLPKKPQPR